MSHEDNVFPYVLLGHKDIVGGGPPLMFGTLTPLRATTSLRSNRLPLYGYVHMQGILVGKFLIRLPAETVRKNCISMWLIRVMAVIFISDVVSTQKPHHELTGPLFGKLRQ